MNASNLERARINMAEQQVRPWEVLDPRVIEALRNSRRESFVPATHTALAYADTVMPLGHGASMFTPKLEGHAAQALQLKPTDRVLEIGTGSGYMAALLASLSAQVSTVEIVPELVALAKDNLKRAGVTNVTVHEGNGLAGLPGDAPFDAIMVSGSLTTVPEALLQQLRIGGRLFVVTGEAPAMTAQCISRTGESIWQTANLFETSVGRLCEPAVSSFKF